MTGKSILIGVKYLVWLSPYLMQITSDDKVKDIFAEMLFAKYEEPGFSPNIDDQIFQTIKIQLMALDLVKVESLPLVGGGTEIFWKLNETGLALMMSMRTVKTNQKK